VALGAVALWQHRAPIDIALLNPAWFLPIVGHVLVAHAGVQLGYVETSWLVVGLSTPLWILVQTLLFYRNVFAAPLPPRLLPTLTIQIGPAPLIFLALIELQPGLDAVMRIIFYAGIGLMLVLWLPRLPQFLRLPFALSHWSFSFPLSAMAASMLAFADRAGSPAMWSAATLFLILPVLTTSYALIATLRAWRHGVFAKPEP
jgi:tellurite resistance protein